MRRFALATALTSLLAATGATQEAVTVRPPTDAKAGQKLRVSEAETSKTAMDFVAAGEKMVNSEENTRSVVYVQEVVTAAGKGGGQPLKLKRTYEKYEATDDGKPAPGPPLDTPIVIEKGKEKYTFDAGGKKIAVAFLKKLDDEFNAPGKDGDPVPDFLPPKPVKAGDTWKLPAKRMFSTLEGGDDGPKLDLDKVTSGGKVLKVYRKGGERFVVLEMSFAAPMLSLGKDGPKISDASMSAKLTTDFCADRAVPTSTTTSSTKMTATFDDPLIKGTFRFEQTTTTTEELVKE